MRELAPLGLMNFSSIFFAVPKMLREGYIGSNVESPLTLFITTSLETFQWKGKTSAGKYALNVLSSNTSA